MGLGLFEVLGGKGSGNFGHAGRPGKVGGSGGGGGRSRPKAGTVLRKVLLDDIADKAKIRKEAPSASFRATSQMSLDGAISRAMRRGVSDEDINKALIKGGMPPMAELTTSPKGGGGKSKKYTGREDSIEDPVYEMDKKELKKYIKDKGLPIKVEKSWDEDLIRETIFDVQEEIEYRKLEKKGQIKGYQGREDSPEVYFKPKKKRK
jgi:hypothetical protein